MQMAAQRNHNEWFRSVSCGGRKSCPSCGEKLDRNEKIWSWGQYVCAKWRTIKHFCKKCSPEIIDHLMEHTAECGCTVTLVSREIGGLPKWLRLKRRRACAVKA
jgi:hypothetical protein